jgi:hypothetical protein
MLKFYGFLKFKNLDLNCLQWLLVFEKIEKIDNFKPITKNLG